MLLNLVFWSFLIAIVPLTPDVAIQLTAAIVQGLASILRKLSARPGHGDHLAPHFWSRPSSH
jgi:hypothetical protein